MKRAHVEMKSPYIREIQWHRLAKLLKILGNTESLYQNSDTRILLLIEVGINKHCSSCAYLQNVTWLALELHRQQCYCSFKAVNSSVVTTVVDMTGYKYLYVSGSRLSLQMELQLASHCLSNGTTTSTTWQSTSCDNLQHQPHPSPDLT